VKIFLYFIGKARDTHANAMAEEYIPMYSFIQARPNGRIALARNSVCRDSLLSLYAAPAGSAITEANFPILHPNARLARI